MENYISKKIVELISEISKKKVSPSKITDSKNLLADLGLDSIAILRIIMDIEKSFEIKIASSDLNIQLFSDFGKLASFVGARLNEKNC